MLLWCLYLTTPTSFVQVRNVVTQLSHFVSNTTHSPPPTIYTIKYYVCMCILWIHKYVVYTLYEESSTKSTALLLLFNFCVLHAVYTDPSLQSRPF